MPSSSSQSTAAPCLIPVRLDLTVDDNVRVHESLLWPSDPLSLTPRLFATQLAADLSLTGAARDAIEAQLLEQLAAHQTTRAIPRAYGECRHVIRLHMRLDRVMLRDQFEWDLANEENSPEVFAETLCKDLGLGQEFVNGVAFAVREQLAEVGKVWEKRRKGDVVHEEEAVRENTAGWEPVVECLSREETEKLERKERREQRLKRRNRGKFDGKIAKNRARRDTKRR